MLDLGDQVRGEGEELAPMNWTAIARLIGRMDDHPDLFIKGGGKVGRRGSGGHDGLWNGAHHLPRQANKPAS